MSFIRADINIRTPTIPGMEIEQPVYFGSGDDSGVVVYNPGNSDFGNSIMTTDKWAYSLKVGGSEFQPVFDDINGYIYWENGSDYIYHVQAYGWVKCDKFPGYVPIENYDSETRKYTGDSFHAGNLPAAGVTGTFEPRGDERDNGSSISVEVIFPRWVCSDSFFGEYEGTDGVSGVKILGVPAFSCDGTTYVRSIEKVNGYYTYGDIRNVSGKWVIGELNAGSGWWEGSEPEVDGSVTFKFCKPKDSDITGSNKTVQFIEYVEGDNYQEAYYGDVAKWM